MPQQPQKRRICWPPRPRSRRPGYTTTTVDRAGVPGPRLPHERDESSDSQGGTRYGVMEQAKEDLDRGLVDTDRGEPMDRLYHDKFRNDGGR